MSLYFAGFIALRILGCAFMVLLGVVAFRSFRRRNDPALAALKKRLVAGEINEDDFRRTRDILES